MNSDYPEGATPLDANSGTRNPHNRFNEEGLRWLFVLNPVMNMQFLNPVNP